MLFHGWLHGKVIIWANYGITCPLHSMLAASLSRYCGTRRSARFATRLRFDIFWTVWLWLWPIKLVIWSLWHVYQFQYPRHCLQQWNKTIETSRHHYEWILFQPCNTFLGARGRGSWMSNSWPEVANLVPIWTRPGLVEVFPRSVEVIELIVSFLPPLFTHQLVCKQEVDRLFILSFEIGTFPHLLGNHQLQSTIPIYSKGIFSDIHYFGMSNLWALFLSLVRRPWNFLWGWQWYRWHPDFLPVFPHLPSSCMEEAQGSKTIWRSTSAENRGVFELKETTLQGAEVEGAFEVTVPRQIVFSLQITSHRTDLRTPTWGPDLGFSQVCIRLQTLGPSVALLEGPKSQGSHRGCCEVPVLWKCSWWITLPLKSEAPQLQLRVVHLEKNK